MTRTVSAPTASPIARTLTVALLALVTLVSFTATVARADRPAIEAVLRAMEKAVLAGDPAAYLVHVCDRDRVFHKEQFNWAADLKKHVPTSFSLQIVEPDNATNRDSKDNAKDKASDFGTDRATFTLRMTWQFDKIAAGRQRSISYPVTFRREGPRWLYQGEEWDQVALPPDDATKFAGVHVKYEPGLKELAEAIGALMPDIRAKVDQQFDRFLPDMLDIKLYRSMLHLQASIYLSYEEGLGGWNEPGESIKILVRGNADAERAARFRPTLAHEYGHAATFALGPSSNDMPWWILEGVAEFVARPYRAGADRRAERFAINAHNNNRLVEWDRITDFRSTPANLYGNVYTQGEHFIAWFTARFGDSARNRWLLLQARGVKLDQATAQVTGQWWDAVDRAYRADVAALADKAKQDEAARRAADESRDAKPDAKPGEKPTEKPAEKPADKPADDPAKKSDPTAPGKP